jgi:DNA-binding transcriptional regulator LsrR (DeoR family)
MSENLLTPEETLQAVALARRHYLDGRSKSELADEFKISRFRVARLLDRARELGIVRIEIVAPAHGDSELSERLRRVYSLRHAVAVETPAQPELLRANLGEAAARLLPDFVVDGDTLGIAWGRTLQAMVGALNRLPQCTVVQLTGAVGRIRVHEESVEIVRRVADAAGGSSYPIYAPMVVDTAAAAAALRREPHVREALKAHDRLTKAVVAIGSISPPDSLLYEGLGVATCEALRRQGACGETCAIPVAEDGRLIADVLDRTINITPDKFRRIPEVLAVAGGAAKVAAIRAVLASGVLTALITDVATARALLGKPVPAAPRRPSGPRRG